MRTSGIPGWWDPWHNEARDAESVAPLTSSADRRVDAAGTAVHLLLERRESRVLVVRPGQDGNRTTLAVAERGGTRPADPVRIAVSGPWRVTDLDGCVVAAPALGDWTTRRALELFSGTLVYETEITLSGSPQRVDLDLGMVGDIAVVIVNGAYVGSALWAPYRITRGRGVWRAGRNLLQVQVTNSAANSYDGAMRPSGLMGPVSLQMQ